MEAAVSVLTRKPFNNERVVSGDIVAIRRPSRGVGFRELSEFLWLRLTGPEVDQLSRLSVSLEEAGVVFDKRRFCIPLDRLPAGVDLARIADPADAYQPFLPVDEETGLWLEGAARAPLKVAGLVCDKTTGLFL